MAAPCAFGVKGMDSAALDRRHRMLDRAILLMGVRVDHHLHAHGISDAGAALPCRRCCTPILVQRNRASPLRARRLRPSHTVADELAAASLHVLSIRGQVMLNLDDMVRIAKPDTVAGGGGPYIAAY